MPTVAIVYFSGTGHTHLMAQAIAEGASKVEGTTVEVLRIVGEQIVNGRWKDDATIEKLNNADAIVFGSPTYMGGVAAQLKAFIDAASGIWFKHGWKDKIAAGFTHSSSPSGDKQGTLLYLATNAAQHGMIWVNVGDLSSFLFGKDDGINRLGSFLGVMGQSQLDMSGKEAEIDAGDRLTSERFGQRIAEITKRWVR
ncbi:MAG: NAD(P)H-dependent oxidoreductase [Brasilonema octagenarum HA4186-MV1]|jgi:NAD(P)H dehydrogenase (quinone)|uniref:Flavodoxin family protein n=2 Tax=Brasilonema TaxID=383614 RepID=A0A856MIL4_9CYAN|nr:MULTISPECIES: flavodoxin family protein [Brasilonema]MBW4629860.1 NAD(P)H-dependent oxidoreductase [Brasilonema octagenarum HA4186-MV1]NMF61547.1 flavodoxin family protein [Brasilonema octagenarum UFV-OR1]QDL10030.1 flavodoxin family protein [Brasilonema sennae CENA114]QDL16383.1 flavodoxin family protein [Brasilonema octagenarum UFV-E1]